LFSPRHFTPIADSVADHAGARRQDDLTVVTIRM
jgi:hypothetical protein